MEDTYIGKIIKGIGGFYYVDVPGEGVFACRARGLFRKEGKKPLVGDMAEVQDLGGEPREGSVVRLLPRKSEMLRPAVANIDLGLAVMAFTEPAPNLDLLDAYLVLMEKRGIPAAICFNKDDLADETDIDRIKNRYQASGYPLFFVSVKQALAEAAGKDMKITGTDTKAAGTNVKEPGADTEEACFGDDMRALAELLNGKTTALSGPSGVGKSSLTNYLLNKERGFESAGRTEAESPRASGQTGEDHVRPVSKMETGELSQRTKRGKNTTRHTELMRIGDGTYIMDTPGFTSLYLEEVEAGELKHLFPEFTDALEEGQCRFQDCMHDREPDCAVKAAVAEGKIPQERYNSYIRLYHELKERREY